jgi:Tfp pilus assembly protein PilF
MFSPTRATFALNRKAFQAASLMFATILFLSATSYAQRGNAVSNGTFGNEIIEGQIYFPKRQKPVIRPIVKLQGDSTGELTTVATPDGTFIFNRLRPDSYVIVVNGGDEYETARESVQVGSAGPVPAQGNPASYAMPVVYQVQIYLQPKGAGAVDAAAPRAMPLPAGLPQKARELFIQGLESARAGEIRKAIEQFEAAIFEASAFGPAYNELGVQYLKLGQADKAAEAFEAAIKIGPDVSSTRLNYGLALLNLKKFAEAEQQFRRALQKNQLAPTTHYYLGLALMSEQKFEAAETEFKTSITNSSDRIALAHKYLGGIYWRNKQYRLAADELERYVKLEPNAGDADKIRGTIKELRAKK